MVSRMTTAVLRRPLRHLIAAGVLAAMLPSPALADCADILPAESASPAAERRPVSPDDIMRLREIGQPDGFAFRQPTPLAVSPDGSQVAFVLTRADAATNSYCRALVVMPIEGVGTPRVLADAGDMILNETATRGSMITVGYVAPTTPLWSPDGRWIVFQRREAGSTRLWRVASTGGEPRALSKVGEDVEAFVFSPDGTRLIVGTRPGVNQTRRAVEQEALGGWLYDARVVPNMAARPQIPAGLPIVAAALDPLTGASLAPLASDQTALDAAIAAQSRPAATAPDGRRAWVEPRDARPISPVRLLVDDGDGGRLTCSAESCGDGIFAVWWDAGGREVRYLRKEGWAEEQTVLYRWAPGESAPRAVLSTTDVLLGCVPAASTLLCLREGSSTPRHLVRIDPESGTSHPLWDPNPEFASIRLGTVERLRWRNQAGRAAWGDLVLPPDYRPGTRLPLIVVQYHSDGFLRGGVGNEYPIFAFAARGFAVLSVERAPFVAEDLAGIDNWDAFNAANLKNWTERRNQLSSVLTGVDAVIARGVADPARIGITGLSDGASTVRFALINSDRFAAASISSCCVDAQTSMIYAGIAYADLARSWGSPPATRPDPDFWRPYSVALNAERIDRPLLMQLADAEYLFGLETFMALREHRQPVELHVFPGEFHMKWQPAHRRAIYERNLDWFSFWLQGQVDPDPAKAAQYRRWQEMRARRGAAVP